MYVWRLQRQSNYVSLTALYKHLFKDVCNQSTYTFNHGCILIYLILALYITVTYTYKPFTYIIFIAIYLQLRFVNVAIVVCFRNQGEMYHVSVQ